MRIREPDIAWTQVGDEIVILDTRTSVYSRLNSSAAKLWLALSTGATSIDEMVTVLRKEYGIDEQIAAIDVMTFLTSLRAGNMLLEDE